MRTNVIFASRDLSRASLFLEMLGRNGYSVVTTQKAKEALGFLAQRSCDLLVLSQHLADEDGLVFLKNLRNRNKSVPVIAILESPDTVLEHMPPGLSFETFFPGQPAPRSGGSSSARITIKLAFFQLGADECLSYSQDLHESLARIRAVLRRVAPTLPDEVMKMGELSLNLSSYTLKISGSNIPLTAKEFDLLFVFLSSPNRVLSRPYLIERVWGYNYFGSPRTVDVHVRRLREKLGKAARYVHTVPCVGYKLVPPNSR
ncbi:MAG: response regulator transcription factor [bacterium]